MMRAEGRQGGRDNLLDHWARVQGEAGHGGQGQGMGGLREGGEN